MMDFFSFKICLMGFFRRIKISKVFSFVIDGYCSTPFFGMFWLGNTFSPSILSIDCRVRRPEIANSVVRFFAINVVYDFWQKSIHKKKCSSVGVLQFPINPENNIPVFIDRANWFGYVYDGKKQASIRVVTDVFKIFFVHAVAPPCNGLKSNGLVLTHQAVAPL